MFFKRRKCQDLPFILGIGAQKSGTTWLFEYLDKREDIYMHPLKEVHFFDALYEPELWPNAVKNRIKKEKKMRASLAEYRMENNEAKLQLYEHIRERNRYYRNPALYMRHFEKNVGNCRAFGEITPEYSTLSAESFRRIFENFPNVHFVFLARDPVDRIWSQIKMLSKFERPGFEAGRSIGEKVACALGKERILLRSRYDVTLKNLLTCVPEKHLFIGFFEEMYDDRCLRKLCEYLSIPFVVGDYDKIVNESRGDELDPENAAKIRSMLGETYDYFENRFGLNLPEKWQARIGAG